MEKINIPIYEHDVLISVDETDDELYEQVKHSFKSRDEFDNSWINFESSNARTICHDRDGYCIIRFKKEPLKHSLIAHEAFHATHFILDRVGIRLSDDSDEAFAYLLGYIIENIYLCLDRKQYAVSGHRSKG